MKAQTIGTTAIVMFAVIVCFLWIDRVNHPLSGVKPPCRENLIQLQHSKQIWKLDNKKTELDIPTWDDLRPLLEGFSHPRHGLKNGKPVCPLGGTYTLGRVGEAPKCSIGGDGHDLPDGFWRAK